MNQTRSCEWYAGANRNTVLPGLCAKQPVFFCDLCPHIRQKRILRGPAMTLSWLDRLLEKGEPNSSSYDFCEARPFWTMGWFRVYAVPGVIAMVMVWSFCGPF